MGFWRVLYRCGRIIGHFTRHNLVGYIISARFTVNIGVSCEHLISWDSNEKVHRRWRGTSTYGNKRNFALWTNALRAYEGESLELIPTSPRSRESAQTSKVTVVPRLIVSVFEFSKWLAGWSWSIYNGSISIACFKAIKVQDHLQVTAMAIISVFIIWIRLHIRDPSESSMWSPARNIGYRCCPDRHQAKRCQCETLGPIHYRLCCIYHTIVLFVAA